MSAARASGILLHPSALPPNAADDAGSGDFGDAAHAFVDWLAEAGQSLWQILPLNPPGPGDSPYTSVSSRAGNPALIALAPLLHAGWLAADDLAELAPTPDATPTPRIDFATSTPRRLALLRRAAERFFAATVSQPQSHAAFETWCRGARDWLPDYALFMALKAAHGETSWADWPADLAARVPAALAAAQAAHVDDIRFWAFVQWQFDTQWQALRAHAAHRGVRIIGDMPIYVAWDSVDVWTQRDLFELDAAGRPRVVAGVPPDYFSADGQLWGNPLYRWSRHAADGYAWWQGRLRAALAQADLVRIDHFRAFESYWEVAAGAPKAIDGCWQPGPGRALFSALSAALGAPLPVIAEDLGIITAEVVALREAAGLPGMRVLQFAFGAEADDLNLPHCYPEACAVYTGTHDNDTTLGWFATASARERDFARRYLERDGSEIGWDLIRAASASVARYAIYPLQDVLGLGSEARMNIPGVAGGQWGWRAAWAQFAPWQGARLRALSAVHGRNRLALDFLGRD